MNTFDASIRPNPCCPHNAMQAVKWSVRTPYEISAGQFDDFLREIPLPAIAWPRSCA
jgi:hypothetical protein